MIDLGIELDGYGEDDKKPNTNPRFTDFESKLNNPRRIGKLSDMQDQGFITTPVGYSGPTVKWGNLFHDGLFNNAPWMKIVGGKAPVNNNPSYGNKRGLNSDHCVIDEAVQLREEWKDG